VVPNSFQGALEIPEAFHPWHGSRVPISDLHQVLLAQKFQRGTFSAHRSWLIPLCIRYLVLLVEKFQRGTFDALSLWFRSEASGGAVHASEPDPNSKRDSSIAVLVDNSGHTRYISFSNCRFFADFKEAYCDVDGERVTTWTTQKSSFSMPPIIGGLGGGAAQRSASSPSG
jgi:hypothetical protein